MNEVIHKKHKFAFCPDCGYFLQKAIVAHSEQICPGCNKTVVVSIKNGRVTVFDANLSND